MDQRITQIIAQDWNGVEIVVATGIWSPRIGRMVGISIYWFGFKRRHVIANGEVGFDPATN